MKGLATLLIASVLVSFTAGAGPLEIWFGAGPSATAFGSLNASVGIINTLITHLNETFETHPDVTGSIGDLAPLQAGFAVSAGERFWLADWIGLGAAVGYSRAATGALGHFEGAEISTIDVSLDVTNVHVSLGGRATFLDVGLRLAADAAVTYDYVISNGAVLFEVPTEYPGTVSGVPPASAGRYTGDTFGFEFGLALSYPVAPWVSLGASITYRSATIGTVADSAGTNLDFDGDGDPEPIDLDGISVKVTISFNIDLSLNGEKE
jgi:hypothetical protein